MEKKRAARARLSQEQLDEEALATEEKRAQKLKLTKAISATFATADGRETLRYLMNICGYQSPSTVGDSRTGEVQVNSTVYNEARRNLYLTLRQHVSAETLIAVEIGESHNPNEKVKR